MNIAEISFMNMSMIERTICSFKLLSYNLARNPKNVNPALSAPRRRCRRRRRRCRSAFGKV